MCGGVEKSVREGGHRRQNDDKIRGGGEEAGEEGR